MALLCLVRLLVGGHSRRTVLLCWAGGIRSTPAVVGDVVYTGSQDRSLHAVDRATGVGRWRYETPGPLDDSSPVVADGLVHVGSLSNAVFAVDAETGEGPPA